jgi:hypothetical protein
MKDEDELDRSLRALLAETDADAAPAVEARLRAAFRALPAEAAPAPRAEAGPWVWIASLAAAAGIGALVLAGRAAVEAPVVRPAAPAVRAESTPVPRVSLAPAPVATAAAAARPARSKPRRRPAEPAPFEALYPGDPLADLDAVHVVRVSVPRSSLFALGLRQRPGSQDDAVEMDAMVGPDGVARAVRFVTAR